MSEPPHQQVFRINAVREDRECQNVDIIRCRRNMLCNSVYSWCVFSIWDDITPRESCDLKDFNFVTKPAPTNAKEMAKQAAHTGPGWRSKEVCAFLLNIGVLTWDDISHGIDATCKLPPDYFTQTVEQIEAFWNKTSEPDTQKQAINSMIGL